MRVVHAFSGEDLAAESSDEMRNDVDPCILGEDVSFRRRC
jgi:hypothetical protein